MSGFYSPPGDSTFQDDHTTSPPLFLEDIDAAFESPAGAYQPSYSSAPGDGAPTWASAPADAFGLSYMQPFESSGYSLDSQAGYPSSAAHYPSFSTNSGHSGVAGYPVVYDGDAGARGSSSAAPMGGSHRVYSGSPYLSPNPNATLSPNPNSNSPTASTRSASPNSTTGLDEYGIPQADGTWKCAFPGCRSAVSFARPCDLRKHYHRHEKRYFCRYDGCERSEAGARAALQAGSSKQASSSGATGVAAGSSSTADSASGVAPAVDSSISGVGYGTRKDRDRHERTHNPGIACPAPGCARRFARADNMRDHYKRIHLKAQAKRR